MELADVQQRMLDHYGIRVEPEMARYVLHQLEQAGALREFPVIGGNARTGIPIRMLIDRATLLQPAAPITPAT